MQVSRVVPDRRHLDAPLLIRRDPRGRPDTGGDADLAAKQEGDHGNEPSGGMRSKTG